MLRSTRIVHVLCLWAKTSERSERTIRNAKETFGATLSVTRQMCPIDALGRRGRAVHSTRHYCSLTADVQASLQLRQHGTSSTGSSLAPATKRASSVLRTFCLSVLMIICAVHAVLPRLLSKVLGADTDTTPETSSKPTTDATPNADSSTPSPCCSNSANSARCVVDYASILSGHQQPPNTTIWLCMHSTVR
jgi:hypothetical protein